MESNTTPEVTTDPQTATVDLRSETPGKITATKTPPADGQVQEYLNVGSKFLSRIFEYIKEFVDNNQKSLVNLLLIFLGIIAVKVTLAVIAAVNDIPLLAPTFELVGLSYSGWFVYRYLLTKSSRQELVQEFESLKTQVVGQDES
ncbi:CAAD domain-containing protein [Pleurocapsa sp. FMAR1]|uniref:CAAD domain-containing protein n=1 Tax=Pleurocapsa sp. FMAR1 TaxID=3040204 RepID=UPI0029C65E0C|nr:CAAD domain-containing protein [Pleurocapsa sp. FMAR1]